MPTLHSEILSEFFRPANTYKWYKRNKAHNASAYFSSILNGGEKQIP